jgi:bis(5'-adenosyl)-triphosphatase
MECPFCESSFLNAVFAESQNFMAAYNLAPILPGHVLIVPKNHIESILDLSDDDLSEMMIFSRKVTKLLLRVFKAEAFDWSIQDQEAAGQTISHLHMHIVPRIKGDLKDPGDWYPKINENYKVLLDSDKREKLSNEEIKRVVSRLRDLSHNEGNNSKV